MNEIGVQMSAEINNGEYNADNSSSGYCVLNRFCRLWKIPVDERFPLAHDPIPAENHIQYSPEFETWGQKKRLRQTSCLIAISRYGILSPSRRRNLGGVFLFASSIPF